MKQFLATAAIAALAAADDYSRCLYCRRMSLNAGFLETYSYCNQTDTCLQDAWNYLDRPCGDNQGWVKGSDLHLGDFESEQASFKDGSGDCGVEETKNDCPDFESTPEMSGEYQNFTWSLKAGEICGVRLDATKYLARVIFDNSSFLGIEYDGAKIGEPITVENGIKTIWVYNGAESGSLTFEVSFSGASQIAAGVLALAAATLTTF